MPRPVAPRPVAAKPPTDLQIAQSTLQPAVDAITNAINSKATSAANAVTGYTKSLADQLSQIDYGSPYASAIPQQAAVDEALRASLAGRGADLSQGLASRLSVLNAPGAVNPAVSAVADFGSRAGTTAQAMGSAALGQLIANEAAARGYGVKQPGIARELGLQNLGRVQGQAVQDIADQTAPLYAKIPDIVANVQANRVAQANAQARADQIAFEQRLAAKTLGLKTASTKASIAKTNASINQGATRVAIAQQNANTAATRAANAQANADRSYRLALNKASKVSQAKASSSLSKEFGYLVDTNGTPILRNGQKIMLPKTTPAAAAKPLTVGQGQRATADAYGIAQNGLAGRDGKGNPAPKLNVGQAWAQMQLHGLLADPRTKAIAIKALVQTYGRAGARFVRRQGIAP